MFHHVSSSATSLSLENPPEALVDMIDAGGYDMIPVFSEETDYDLQKDVSVNYDSFDEFEDDFDMNLSRNTQRCRCQCRQRIPRKNPGQSDFPV